MANGWLTALRALAGLSELAAGVSAYSRYRQQQRGYGRQQGRMAELIGEAQRRRGEAVELARQPITAEPYYTPMSEVERNALQRQIKAELISRGLPPDAAYTSALTAELMARTESDRYFRSLDLARGQRGDVLAAMAPGDILGAMQFRAGTPRPTIPDVGQFGALGRTLALEKILEARRQAGGGPVAGEQRIPLGAGGGEVYTGPRYGWQAAPAAGAAWPATPYEGSPYGYVPTELETSWVGP